MAKEQKIFEEQMSNDCKGQKIYIFNDDEQRQTMFENLNMLRKDRQFCDVILQVGTNEIYAHKVVLSSASPYLLEMFTNDSMMSMMMISSNNSNDSNNINHQTNGNSNGHRSPINHQPPPQHYRLVNHNSSGNHGGHHHYHHHHQQQRNLNPTNVSEFDPEAFEYIIEYAYTSVLKIPANKIKEIYSIASRLKMTNVAYKCGQVLLSTLSTENCLEVRNMKAVLKDPYLLQSVDSYIKQNFQSIVNRSSVFDTQQLPQLKIEFLLNSEQEEMQINDRIMFNEVLDWIRCSYEKDSIDLNQIHLDRNNVLIMLFYNKDRNVIQDCSQIESNSPEESEMIEDYKKLNKRISLVKSLSNDSIPASVTSSNGTNVIRNKQATQPSKPRQFLFTRSDSESSLSSVADDCQEEGQDWKVLATCRIDNNNHTMVGLVSILGQLYLLSITLRIKEIVQNSFNRSKDSDSDSGEYCLIPPMSSPRCATGTAEINSKLLVCGGYNRGECLRTVELYDPVENRWEILQPMQVPRGRFNIAVVNGTNVYAIGGCDGQNELNSAEVFDVINHEWHPIQPAPVARSNAGVCSMNNKIYMIGGWNGNRGMTRCDIYDPQTDHWSKIAPLLTGRYQMGACVLYDTIYAVGGCDSWSCLNSVEAFTTLNGQWRLVAPLQTARRGCGVAVYQGKIYVVGGHDGVHALCSVEIYDPIEDEWIFGKPMTQARANVGVAVIGDRLYAVGGFNGKTFLNTIEYFDFEQDQWTNSVPIININTINNSPILETTSTAIGKDEATSSDHPTSDTNNNNSNNNNNQETKKEFMKITKGMSSSNNLSSEPLVEVEETIIGH